MIRYEFLRRQPNEEMPECNTLEQKVWMQLYESSGVTPFTKESVKSFEHATQVNLATHPVHAAFERLWIGAGLCLTVSFYVIGVLRSWEILPSAFSVGLFILGPLVVATVFYQKVREEKKDRQMIGAFATKDDPNSFSTLFIHPYNYKSYWCDDRGCKELSLSEVLERCGKIGFQIQVPNFLGKHDGLERLREKHSKQLSWHVRALEIEVPRREDLCRVCFLLGMQIDEDIIWIDVWGYSMSQGDFRRV